MCLVVAGENGGKKMGKMWENGASLLLAGKAWFLASLIRNEKSGAL